MARRISNQDGDQNEKINNYLEEVKKNLLLNITHYAKLDSSMRSETSDDTQEAQPCESEKTIRVMELPKNSLDHWKAKFIDGLSPLFAERLSRQLKIDKLRERSQLGDFCTQFDLPDLGKQAKPRDSRDSNPDKPYRKNFLYTSGSESDYDDDDYDESGSETDKPETSGNTQSATIDACKCRGDICSCENDKFYKLQSQFEDININTITSDNVKELLKEVTDNTVCEKIIQLATNNKASSSNIVEKSKNEFEYSTPYSLSEINDRLSRQHVVIRDTSFDDLKGEIEQLKQKIKSLKQNQKICEHRLSQIESVNNKGNNIVVEENTLTKPINTDPRQNMFLGVMQIVTAHK
ncbi:hypothetical protein H5410_057511 [Solanum commersonii]|uniref:Uncharacterized protein n=1 Tax=Solanum commersonii TaxID=4109 RepID=A0A9J5WNA3_SOLCO|nr:hypothetical protein H5410_057511 [Solanum commersonii]